MAAFGALAPFGLLAFGSDESDAEKIYRSMATSVSDAFDVTQGTHVEATIYARAISLASTRAVLRHGHDQKHPRRAVEMLPALERDYQIVPVYGQSDEDRRKVVAARKLLSRGNRRESLESALTSLLGTDFVALRTVKQSEAVQWPSNPATVGAFEDPARVQRSFKATTPIAVTGISFTFTYDTLGADDGSRIFKDDVLCFSAENSGLAEHVTITAADPVAKTAAATFARGHDDGCSILSYAPLVTNTQRTLVVAVKSSAARDPTKRRLIDELLSRMARGVTRWSIVEETTSLHSGPFTVGVSKIGVTSIGASAFALT